MGCVFQGIRIREKQISIGSLEFSRVNICAGYQPHPVFAVEPNVVTRLFLRVRRPASSYLSKVVGKLVVVMHLRHCFIKEIMENPTAKEYTVILNYYNKSPALLRRQVNAILAQSLPPKHIWACFLGGDEKSALLNEYKEATAEHENAFHIVSDYNFKYIGRYQLALTAPTDYIVVLDDDRLPSTEYCARMLAIITKEDCIVQQYGWKLKKPEEFGGHFYMPVPSKYNPCLGTDKDALIEVDYLCGGMAFRKSSLTHLFKESIPTVETGEDILFCFRARKNGVPVYVHMPSSSAEILYHDNEDVNSTVDMSHIEELRTCLIEKEAVVDLSKR